MAAPEPPNAVIHPVLLSSNPVLEADRSPVTKGLAGFAGSNGESISSNTFGSQATSITSPVIPAVGVVCKSSAVISTKNVSPTATVSSAIRAPGTPALSSYRWTSRPKTDKRRRSSKISRQRGVFMVFFSKGPKARDDSDDKRGNIAAQPARFHCISVSSMRQTFCEQPFPANMNGWRPGPSKKGQ